MTSITTHLFCTTTATTTHTMALLMDPHWTSTGPRRAPLLDPMWALWGITQTLQGLELAAEDATKSSPVLCKRSRLLSQLDTPTALAVGDPHFAGFRGPQLLWLYKTITSVAAVDLPPLWLLEAPTCLAVGDPHCFGCRRPPLLWLSETPTSDRRARGYRDEVALGPLGAYSRCFLCWWVGP